MNDTQTEAGIYILLGEIKGQLASVLTRIDARNAEDDKKHAKHEDRLAALEKAKWIILGASAAAGTGGAALFQLLGIAG